MGRNKITFCKGHTINCGRVLTPEHKEKIRLGILRAKANGKIIGHQKGVPAWNKGINIDVSHLHTEEVRKKISLANTGNVQSEETKRKLSAMNKGIHSSPRTEFKKGMVSLRKGVKLSAEERERISERMKLSHNHSPEAVKKMLARHNPSSLEEKFQKIITKNKLPYKFVGNGSFMIGRKNPDFININGEKIAIEVYAKYYKLRHEETIKEWKEKRQKVFREYGWKILFFDETQVNEKTVLKQLRR